METDSEDYSEYLEQKYLPGRDIYLHKFFYTRIARELGSGSEGGGVSGQYGNGGEPGAGWKSATR